MLLVEFYNQILTEEDVYPISQEHFRDHLEGWKNNAIYSTRNWDPSIHNTFFKKIWKAFMNNDKRLYPQGTLIPLDPRIKYGQGAGTDDKDKLAYINKKAPTQVYAINDDAVGAVRREISKLFAYNEGQHPSIIHDTGFARLHDMLESPDTPTEIKNKFEIIKKNYAQGKLDLDGLKNELKDIKNLGTTATKWKSDPGERQRVETEAPIIMKFKNGYMWVRLDSKEEMEREGEMMQNCISGYCPVGQEGDITFGLRKKFTDLYDPPEHTDDNVDEFLTNWVEENGSILDYLEEKLEDVDPAELDLTNVLEKSDDEIFVWMRTKIIDADADIETGAPPGGHLIYSLRDKHGESHISAEYDPQMDMDYIEPTEALGKQNRQAVNKYKPYIEKLNNFFAENPETFGPLGNTQDMPFHPDYDDDKEHSTADDIAAFKARGDAVSGGTMTAKEWDEWRLTQPTNNPHTRPLS